MEIAIKHAIGKMEMDGDMTRQGIRDLQLSVLPFRLSHAHRLFSLPLHHRDPFDRMILATALAENYPLVGGDREFLKYEEVEVIW